MTNKLTYKRVLEIWYPLPIIVSSSSNEWERNTYFVHVLVRPEACINNEIIEGFYVVTNTSYDSSF